jgi:hypothetical protein
VLLPVLDRLDVRLDVIFLVRLVKLCRALFTAAGSLGRVEFNHSSSHDAGAAAQEECLREVFW